MSNKDGPKHERNKSPISARKVKKLLVLSNYISKQETRKTFKLVTTILQKKESERTAEEETVLKNNKEVVKRIQKNKERKLKSEERVQEREDGEQELQTKCARLAKYIRASKKVVVYTGAGISTAASIPDYRGPQGVWTLLQKGETLQPLDLSDAEPTFTHMCIAQLHKEGHVKHVVSQNCDGLHLRSGLPRRVLSEVHGNMYIEVCHKCKPHREYIRLFDATESTGVRRHHTGRFCKSCGGQLRDTIVHFGEKGGLKSPYRWKEASKAAEKSDLILCLGSSLKILKSYGCLWLMDRARSQRPNLVIVNLQWTPKDDAASLKINGRCDDVLKRVMKILGYNVEPYAREADPIFRLYTPLAENELETTTKKVLETPSGLRNLRSRSSSRSPTPSVSESSSSSQSSSTDSSDTVETTETDSEEKPLVPEKPLDEVLDDVKVFLDKEKDESLFMNDLQDKDEMVKEEIKTDKDKQSMNSSAYLGSDHMYSAPDNAKNIADSEVQNLESNTLNIAEAVDTDSLHVYRQLLQLHLLQKQLEMLKCQQREQQVMPQQYVPGHNQNFSLPFYHSPGPPLALSQFSSRLPQNSARPSVSVGQYGAQACPPSWPVGLYPNCARFSNNTHLSNNDLLQKKQCLRMKMGQMHNQGLNSVYSQRHMHNQGINPVTTQDSFLNYAYSPMNLELEKHMKTAEEMHSQNTVKQSPVKTHQINSLLPSVTQSNLSDFITNYDLPGGVNKQLLNVTKQTDLVQNLERRVQMDREQEKHVREIQQQLELEHDRFLKGQNYAQQSQEQPRLQTRTGEKKDQNQKEMISIVDELIDYEKKLSLNSSGLHKVPVVENVRTQVSVDHKNVFKEPLPFHSYPLQQTNALKPAGLGCINQNRSLSAKSSSSKSKNDNVDCRGSDNAKNPDKSEIPGFSELVNSLTMCQTCQFLREYGVNKRSCSMCKDLKAAHSVLNTQWMPNKMTSPPKSPRKSPDSSRMNNATRTSVSRRKMNSESYSEKVCHRVESASSGNGFDLQNKSLQSEYMQDPSAPTSIGSHGSVRRHSDHMVKKDLLKYGTEAHTQHSNEQQLVRKPSDAEGDKIHDHKPQFDLGSTDEPPNKNPMQGVPATSNVLTSASSMLPGSFSPKKHDSSVMKMDTYHLKMNPDINRVNSEPELSKVVENTCLEGTVDQREVSEKASNKGIKRSHSQSEVEQGIDDISEIVEETVEIDEAEAEQPGKKRKLLRCVSVPGWFGKGLNIKKRRKY